jgi:outer membrane receptor for ferrienterochelin and colicins
MRQLLIHGLMGGLSLGLGAQEPPVEDLQELVQILDQPVAAASKRIQRLKEAPADMTVLNASELQALGYRTLAEALEGVLGFRVNRDRAYDGLGVRGLYVLGDQNTRVLILLDGHPLNSPAEVGSGKAGEDFGIPMTMVSRIEIVRGPASSLYGNNAFLGMVNVVTQDPAAGKTGGEALLAGSSRGLGSFDGRIGGTLGASRWQLIASGMQRTGSETEFPALAPDFPSTYPAELDREERQSAYFKAGGKDWSGAGYAMSRTQLLASAPFGSSPGSPLNRYRNRILFGDFRYEPTLGGVETLVRVFGDRNEFSASQDYRGDRDPESTEPFREQDPDRSLGAELQARIHASKQLLLTFGAEYSSHRYDGLACTPDQQVATRVAFSLGNSYLQADWTPHEALSAVVGLQYSEWRVTEALNITDGQTTAMDRRRLQGLTPRAALIWLPTATDILKLLYGAGYRNPTIFERYYEDGSSYRAQPRLEPERIATLQGIWVHVWSDGLQSQLSYSHSRWQKLIQQFPEGDSALLQFQNDAGTLQGQSLEGELKGRWSGWDIYAQVGLYRWRHEGRVVPNASDLQASLRVIRRWQDWSASAELRHISDRENQVLGLSVPSATTLRLALRWDRSAYWMNAALQDATHARPRHLVADEYAPITSMREDGRTLHLGAGFRF